MTRILFIGDINGRPGRKALQDLLPKMKKDLSVDFTAANAENAAGGFGLTKKTFDELNEIGIDAYTMGNHVWDKKEILDFIDEEEKIIRPANLPPGNAGRGFGVFTARNGVKISVINLVGRVFMLPVECPFRAADAALAELSGKAALCLVDIHAEATSEKQALAYYLDGRVTAVVGTHTHVMTADEHVLQKGTGYITDVGMTGPFDSVIGVEKEIIINRFLTMQPEKFEIATGDIKINAVLIEADETSGKTLKIERHIIPYE